MAADYLVITRSNRPNLGSQLVEAANRLKALRELVDGLNDAGQHMFNGADYTLFEAQFGIASGQGANALSLLGLINTILNSSTDVTGANRASQLEEFTSRLAGQ